MMCLILFSWDSHPKYKLILAANRDEFYERPTKALHRWSNEEGLIAGKDLTGGGTWLGVKEQNRFTALTNYRDPLRIVQNPPSRGGLTTDFLAGKETSSQYFENRKENFSNYNGFNLLTGSLNELSYFNNINQTHQIIKPGIYGLSNAMLDTPWPKLRHAKSEFERLVNQPEIDKENFYSILQNKSLAEDHSLPKTGIPYEWEKAISAIFIETKTYGTCCSTFITVTHDGEGQICELSYPVGQREASEKIFKFDWSSFK